MSFDFPRIPNIGPMLPPGHISGVRRHLENEYEEFVKDLKPNEDLAVSVFLNGGGEIAVTNFGYAGPNLLIVNGKLNDKDVTAYIHQSCLQVVFAKVPKEPNAPRRRMGFENPRTLDETEGTTQSP